MTTPTTVKGWVLAIADAVEKWPTMPKDNVEVAMPVTTPAGAAVYVVTRHVRRDVRSAVARALPLLTTSDFAEAARLIRAAAEKLPD